MFVDIYILYIKIGKYFFFLLVVVLSLVSFLFYVCIGVDRKREFKRVKNDY